MELDEGNQGGYDQNILSKYDDNYRCIHEVVKKRENPALYNNIGASEGYY